MAKQTRRFAPVKHRWDRDNIKRIPACESPSGNNQTERTCRQCGMVRVTVHAPDNRAWPEWRHPKSPNQFACGHAPPCIPPEGFRF